jgi:hypothetical protein
MADIGDVLAFEGGVRDEVSRGRFILLPQVEGSSKKSRAKQPPFTGEFAGSAVSVRISPTSFMLYHNTVLWRSTYSTCMYCKVLRVPLLYCISACQLLQAQVTEGKYMYSM